MPYKNIKQIDPRVRKILPKAAQRIYMKAYNASMRKPVASRHRIAWTAVKNAGYRKGKSGKWRKSKKK